MTEIAKRPGDLLERLLRQPDRSPLGTAHAHVLAKIIQRHGAKEIRLALIVPNVRRIGKRHRRQHAIHEHEQRLIVGAEQRLPMRQAIDIVARRPALPDVARLLRRSAGKLSALDIDEQLGPGRPEHDEVEVLDRHIAEDRPARLIDGDVAKPLLFQERLERGLVGIAAVHGGFPRRY